MCSARTLQSPKSLPDAVPEKNKKDKLYNDLLLLFRSRNMKMKAAEADSIGVKVTRTLCDALWHIDGHHEVFSRWSTPLPATFKQFHDYNLPELSKHRKRQRHNLSQEKLHAYASTLYSDDMEDRKCGALHCNIAVYKRLIIKWVQCDSIFMHIYCVGLKKHLKMVTEGM